MRHIFVPAAIAAVALSFALPATVFAYNNDDNGTRDLGVSVSGIDTSGAVQKYLSSLSPTDLRAVVGGCETYVATRPRRRTRTPCRSAYWR